MLEKLDVVESVEEVVEVRKVTVTFNFPFIDGVIVDPELQAFYDKIAPVAEVAEENQYGENLDENQVFNPNQD